jgi:hypothetical protein
LTPLSFGSASAQAVVQGGASVVVDATSVKADTVLHKNDGLWIVVPEKTLIDAGWPHANLDVKLDNHGIITVLSQMVLVDGLTDKDKANFGIAKDGVVLGFYVANGAGHATIKITVVPKINKGPAFVRELHVFVQ